MPSSTGKGGRGKVAGALVLVSIIIAYEISCYPRVVSAEPEEAFYSPGLRAVMEELERQGGFGGRVATRAYGSRRKSMIRKSLSPNNFRLRFGKRSPDDQEPAEQDGSLDKGRQQQDTWQGTSRIGQ